MVQQVMIVDDASERTALVAQALRDNGYGVLTVRAGDHRELQDQLRRLRPDILVVDDEVIIDLASEGGTSMLREIGIPA